MGKLGSKHRAIHIVAAPIAVRKEAGVDVAYAIHRSANRCCTRPKAAIDPGLVPVDGGIPSDQTFQHQFHPLADVRSDLESPAVVHRPAAREGDGKLVGCVPP